MIQWKQRLYAFLLRRVLGPFLDASVAHKLHDSLDVSLQEGVFVLKDVVLDSNYLTARLTDKVPGLSIRKATIDRLEIHLTLRENPPHNATATSNSASATVSTTQSSLAWRAMKFGTMNESLPAVSLIADVIIDGISLEWEPIELERRNAPQSPEESIQNSTSNSNSAEEPSSKNVIGSYIDAALASLQLNLKLTNVDIKLCHTPPVNDSNNDGMTKEQWLALKVSMFSYKSLDVHNHNNNSGASNTGVVDDPTLQSSYKMVVHKLLEFSEITIVSGESLKTTTSHHSDGPSPHLSPTSTIALAQGNGQIYYRVIEYHNNLAMPIAPEHFSATQSQSQVQQDIEVKLNHQLNLSVDQMSLARLQILVSGFSDISEANNSQSTGMSTIAAENSLRNNPHIFYLDKDTEMDRDDLKALTGIMRQYREAYHLAEKNQLRGGILVPSNAYLDDVHQVEEEEDSATFDVFFDANDQSFYNATSVLARSMRQTSDDSGDDDDDDDQGEVSDHVNTKLRFHLLSGCLKIGFRQPGQINHSSRPQEYMLLTVEDVSLSLSSTHRTSEISMSILHLDIEDAQFFKRNSGLDDVSVGSATVFENSVEIGKILEFLPDNTDTGDDYGDTVLSQAPCISCHWRRTKSSETINITLLGMELCFRHRTVLNLSQLKLFLQERATETTTSAASSTALTHKPHHKRRRMELSCACPSLTLTVPLLRRVSTGPMFSRFREVISNASVTEGSIGISFENNVIELMSQPDQGLEPGQSHLSGGFSCHQILAFALCPEGDVIAFGSRMLRKDILGASGRVEVNPFIPISFNFARVLPNGKETNPGRDSFPIVPAISSFKARQEDDDDDDERNNVAPDTDPRLKKAQADFDSRRDLRGSDPQVSMLADAERSTVVATIHIPEIVMDVSGDELRVFAQMVDAAKPPPAALATDVRRKPSSSHKPTTDVTSIAVVCESISLSVCEGDSNGCDAQISGQVLQCVLAMDQVRCHTLLQGPTMRHFRVMSHNPCLYARFGPRNVVTTARQMSGAEGRIQFLKNCIRNLSQSSSLPLLFRSHMFTPISHETPSILFDIIDAKPTLDERSDLQQRRAHLTLYHVTYRYDVESKWIPRLSALFSNINPKPGSDGVARKIENEAEEVQPSMTRLFVSCADMNLDYTSASCFERASRTVVRIGDFRVSSNIMAPAGPVQAYSISMGDLNCHISNSRISHTDENSELCRSSWFMLSKSHGGTASTGSIFGAMPEATLREMGFVNVVSVDMMEAFITKRQDVGTRTKSEPQVSTTLSLGTVSVYACKDSFNCFSETVGELQAKLTALTDEDMTALKEASTASATNVLPHVAPKKVAVPSKEPGERILIPEIELTKKEKEIQNSFLLDGYEWTTIDHDPLKELEISPGDEQRAGWYSSDNNMTGTLPVDVIQQHFPLYAIADPLAEGDMQARRFAGKHADLIVKSRLLIHRLSIRIRFFDGYDWPDSCTEKQREAATRSGKMFVIEPIPPSVAREKEKELSKDIDMKGKSTLTRKAQLMGELLDIDEKNASTFLEAPLPQERALTIDREKYLRLNSRRLSVFFQVSMNGVTLRMDSFQQSPTHRLQSVMELAVSNFFVAETVSMSKPIKMFGEWANDQEHPRDTRFGTVMLSLATWSPLSKVTEKDEVESDECEMSIQLLPMRLLLDQRAITFIRAFVNNEVSEGEQEVNLKKWSDGLHLIPPPNFKVFKIKPWKVKVDYYPVKIDVAALREGSIVELVNISPIHRMVITLSEVTVLDSLGLGPVFSEVVSGWVKEICGTQLHKFLANARPFEPFTDVGQGLTDLVILPYEAFKQGDSVQRAMRKGMKSLAETVIFQTLTTSSGLTKYAADLMADILGGGRPNEASHPLPSRPLTAPKGIQDVRRHVCESLARGIQTANYKVAVVPYREFTRNGVTGAVTSVIRGIPVLLVAPLTGATEAASYTLLGARNALRPDIRKEEEASMSLH